MALDSNNGKVIRLFEKHAKINKEKYYAYRIIQDNNRNANNKVFVIHPDNYTVEYQIPLS